MFEGCESLTSIDLSNFNTQNVKIMERLFSYCRSLRFLDLTSFNTAEVEIWKKSLKIVIL